MRNSNALVVILVCFCTSLYAQGFSVGVFLNGINYHLKKPVNPHLFHRTISKNKQAVYTFGVGVRLGYYMNPYAGLTITQAFIPRDCANRFFGMTHAGVFLTSRYFNALSPHEIILIGGPLLFYRKNWAGLQDYRDDKVMSTTADGRWQYKLVWHGGFLEYQYHYSAFRSVGLHVMPGIPELVSVSGHYTMRFANGLH